VVRSAACAPLSRPETRPRARRRVFAALAGLLTRLRVAVLVVEDMRWADEVTLEFLLYLASRRPRPLSLVVTLRPEDTPEGSLLPRLSRLAAGEAGLRLALGPLDVADTAGLVSSSQRGTDLGPVRGVPA
jgi:predicted ATPase